MAKIEEDLEKLKDKDVHQGIPVAFMACKSKSQYIQLYLHHAPYDWLKNDFGLKKDAFMVNCAEAESHAIGTIFPKTRIHYCDFHVGQLWEKQPDGQVVKTND
ncbi:hypothetical protein BGZ47_002575 [Haplosporangium gracile]|nr:hypothetical protein BGZ47_002575 [Haplosporangium gracile]